MSLGLVLLAGVMSVLELAAGISIAPGDAERDRFVCQSLGFPTPGYAPNMRVLMDSWNYQNLLPPRMGAVWDQVDNDTRNNASITTSVSFHICKTGCFDRCLIFLCSGFSNPTVLAIRLSKCVALLLVLRATGC